MRSIWLAREPENRSFVTLGERETGVQLLPTQAYNLNRTLSTA
jgi:hypothetical protein